MMNKFITRLWLATALSTLTATALAGPEPYIGYPATPGTFKMPGSTTANPATLPGPASEAIDRATDIEPRDGKSSSSGTAIDRTLGSGTGSTGDAGGSSGSGAGTGAGSSAGGGRSGQ